MARRYQEALLKYTFLQVPEAAQEANAWVKACQEARIKNPELLYLVDHEEFAGVMCSIGMFGDKGDPMAITKAIMSSAFKLGQRFPRTLTNEQRELLHNFYYY